MEKPHTKNPFINISTERPIWDQFYMVAPLVVIGSKQLEGYDLAPKHMAMPFGWNNYFGFICTPRHKTYHNIKAYGAFTVSFPRPDDVVLASLTASPRVDRAGSKPILDNLPTRPAEIIDGIFLEQAYLQLECNVERVIDGFKDNSLIVGEIVAAYVHKDMHRASGTDDQKTIYDAPLLAYLPPNRFASIKDSVAFPFPANFEK